jgi:hypothetical protein
LRRSIAGTNASGAITGAGILTGIGRTTAPVSSITLPLEHTSPQSRCCSRKATRRARNVGSHRSSSCSRATNGASPRWMSPDMLAAAPTWPPVVTYVTRGSPR